MLRSRFSSLALPSLLLFSFSAGCATKIPIRSVQPGPVSIGATNHLVILHEEGRRSAREVVTMELINQARSHGYFSVEDRSEDGIIVRVAGRRVKLDGATNILAGRDAGLRLDVLEWTSSRDLKTVTRTDAEGRRYTREVPVKKGEVLLAVTLFDPDGRAFLAEREYQGLSTSRDTQVPREEMLDLAAANAIRNLLNDITPIDVTTFVVLDDSDEAQESIIATAKAGSIAQAADDTRRYLNQNPNNPAAAYNLAVFLDAMGDYQEALKMYDRALRLGSKDFYVSARAGCAKRLAGVQALHREDSRVSGASRTQIQVQ